MQYRILNLFHLITLKKFKLYAEITATSTKDKKKDEIMEKTDVLKYQTVPIFL